MPLAQRVLKVVFTGPQFSASGSGSVTLDETLDLKVKITKAATSVQNRCEVIVSNLSETLRTSLLSQFTAWNKRAVDTNQSAAQQISYINVAVQAGYAGLAAQQVTALQARQGQQTGQLSTTNVVPVFQGQVVLVEPVGEFPNMAIRIVCYSQQVDRTNFQVGIPPGQMTFAAYAQWVADQMQVNLICETSYNNVVVTNPGASIHVIADLIVDLQNAWRPAVAAFFDSSTNTLVVRDVNKVITTANTVTVDEFIGMPLWTEWGVRFKCLFNPQLLLTSAAVLESTMNPSLNKVGYVVYALEYNLTSRDTSFEMTVDAAPPA